MQVSPTTPPAPIATGWIERPDLVGTRPDWDTLVGRATANADVDRLTDSIFELFNHGSDDRLLRTETERQQQWTFASDAAGSNEPQFLYSHSTIRQERVTIAALHAAAAGADEILERSELRSFLTTVDLGHGLAWHPTLAPTITAARQVTVPGRLTGATNGHLITDPWSPDPLRP